ncbi:MAG: TetR/AcrR family transcriptional regulator [Hyphomonadaceae bacterium]|nr:TetR/AcrR family transcriptional regulator [Hyphomonadaceae bacterium]
MSKTPSLRDAHKDLTRTRILDAALEFLADNPLEELTIAGVAKRAAVTERTVYRHFSTREELVEQLWRHVIDRAASGDGFPDTPEWLVRQPRTKFPSFDAEEGVTRFLVFARQGQQLRLVANEERQAAALKAVGAARPDLGPAKRKELAALCQLLDSSFAWVSLKDYWGMDGKTSGPMASEAIQVLLQSYGRGPEGASKA